MNLKGKMSQSALASVYISNWIQMKAVLFAYLLPR